VTALRLRLVARVQRPASPLPRFVTGSLLVHALLVAVLLTLPAFRRTPRSTLPALQVVMLPPGPRVAAGPPAASATTPEVEPPPSEPPPGVSATPVEPPKPKPEAKRTPKPKPTEPPPPQQQPPARQPAAPTGNAEPEAGLNGAGSGTGGPAIAALEGLAPEYNWYRDAVVRALFTSWRQPFLPDNREILEVGVRFEILRDGSVRGVEISSPSGVAVLDRSALRAVLDAALPPLPRDFAEPTQPALFVFRLYPEES